MRRTLADIELAPGPSRAEVPLTLLVKRLAARFALPPEATDTLLDLPFVLRDYQPGQVIVREGDRVRYCTFVLTGFVTRYKLVGDGGRQIVAIHLSGDFVDLQHILLDRADHSIHALTLATVAQFPADALIRLAYQFPEIGKALWLESLVEAATFREWIANVGRRDARARTAHLLCELATRRQAAGLGAVDTFELPMTQEQLGDALGLTSVHINRTLRGLESEGLIRRSKRAVVVADWPALQRAGDFNPNYLHLGDKP